MKTLICSLVVVLGGHLFAGTSYFWYSLTNGAWSKFSDPTSWRTDDFGGSANAGTYPGADDIISGKGGSGDFVHGRDGAD